jgi:predicted HTH transcriptional regulator
MTQLARNTDPDTSKYAAESAATRAKRHKRITLTAIIENGPSTSEEIAAMTSLTHAQAWRRVSDLKNDGKIFDTGVRRRNHSGRMAIVWAAHSAAHSLSQWSLNL